MSIRWRAISAMIVVLVLLVGCTGNATPSAPATEPATEPPSPSGPAPTASEPTAPVASPTGPYALISQESMLSYVAGLASIQPYSGWRNSGTEGEAEALDTAAAWLGEMSYLQSLGLELERQSFHVFLSTELWDAQLELTVGGQAVEVPASGLRGPRDDIAQALRYDSDGALNDTERDPVVVEGPTLLVRSADEIEDLSPADVAGRVVFLDYAAIDRVVLDNDPAVTAAWNLVAQGPAGLVLVTQDSNRLGESHGAFVGDLSALDWVEAEPSVPALTVRLEDLAPAGIEDWNDLERVDAARLTWDADVFSPGTSGNLIARIPGADPSRAVILGAHIDSPNSPGALDDGSGCAVLLEVARVLDAAQVQPPVDLYLAWFGSEELGLYGGAHFANTHQELLDRTVAMLQIDMLSRPLDGIDATIDAVSFPFTSLVGDSLTWGPYLAEVAAGQGVTVSPIEYPYYYSDNSMFTGFDVPNADLIYENMEAMDATGSLHYAAHVHDPYDTPERVAEMGDVLEQMARVALAAALETGTDDPALRVGEQPDRRVVFVGSHTEAEQMAPTTLDTMSLILAQEGFDVDTIPYGQPVTPADLEEAAMVVVLPVLDYPSPDGDESLYDEAWSEDEITALEAYAADGGLLVLTNSAHRLKFAVRDANEDWSDMNALAERFGVTYQEGTVFSASARAEGDHPLVDGVSTLELFAENGIPFTVSEGDVLAQAGGQPVVALVGHEDGEVLVLADLGMLASVDNPRNVVFWQNLARYARSR